MSFPRTPPFQDGVDTLSASTFNDMEARAAAAIAAAQSASDPAGTAANLVSSEQTRAQGVEATLASANDPRFIPAWQPNFAYGAGVQAISPNQQLIQRLNAGTSASTYSSDAGNWVMPMYTSGSPGTTSTIVGSSTPNAPPTSTIIDPLTRPGENPLSDVGNWSVFTNFANNPMAIPSSGQATANAASTLSSAFWNPSIQADQEIWTTVVALGSSDWIALFLRVLSAAGNSYYRFKYLPNGIAIYNGSGTQLGGGAAVIGAGDGILARVYGTTLEAWHQPLGGSWALVGSVTDTSYSSGHVAMAVTSQTAVVGPISAGPVAQTTTASWQNPTTSSAFSIFVKDGDASINAIKNGVVAGGSADQGAALATVLASGIAQGKEVLIPPGEYNINTSHYIQGTPQVHADGAIFLCSHTNDAGFNFYGAGQIPTISSAAGQHAYDAIVNITADCAVNTDYASGVDQVINAPTTGTTIGNQQWTLAPGDIVMLGDKTTLIGGNSATPTAAMLNQFEVKAVLSPSQFTISGPLIYPLLVANQAYMLYAKGLTAANAQGGYWHGGTFIGALSLTSTATASALRLWSLRNFEYDYKIQNFTSFGHFNQDIWRAKGIIDATDLADFQQPGQHTGQVGYGNAWGGACAHGYAKVYATRCRHGNAFVGTGHNCWVDIIGTGTTSTLADAHEGFTASGYITVDADGCPVACALRGNGYRAININARNVSLGFYALDVPSDLIINTLNVTGTIPMDSTADPTGAFGHAVRIDQSCPRFVVENGRWEDIQGHGVYLNLSETTTDLELNVSAQNLQGGRSSPGAGSLVYMTSSSSLNRARIRGELSDNQTVHTTASAIFARGTVNDVVVDGMYLGPGIVPATGPLASSVKVGRNYMGNANVPGKSTLTSSGTLTIDASTSSFQRISMTGNVTSSSITNPTVGQSMRLMFVQNGTGGWTFAWPSNVSAQGGTPIIPSAANAVVVYDLQYDDITSAWVLSAAGGAGGSGFEAVGLASARPAANTVPAGFTYFATDTAVASVSDGLSVWTTYNPSIPSSSGLLSARPSPGSGNAGWKYVATDTGQEFYSDGSSWYLIGYDPQQNLNVSPISVGEELVQRVVPSAAESLTSAVLYVIAFTARKTESITQVWLPANLPSAVHSFQGVGIYSVDGSDNLLAPALATATASAGSASLFGWDKISTFGLPCKVPLGSTFNKVRGSRYALTILHISGTNRTDSTGVTVTNTSPTVLDSNIGASDQGAPVSGTGIPGSTFVGTVTPGTSFLLSSSATTQTNVNATANGTSVTITAQAPKFSGFGIFNNDAWWMLDVPMQQGNTNKINGNAFTAISGLPNGSNYGQTGGTIAVPKTAFVAPGAGTQTMFSFFGLYAFLKP